MDNIATKFAYLNETKNLIKQAIIDKGVTVSDTDTFRSYADKITEIRKEIPSGFTQYDYLDKTSGTGYLDLNFKATNNTKVKLKFMLLSYNGTGANGLFGYYSTSATERYVLTTYSTSAAIPRAIGTNLGTLSAAYNTSSLNTIYEIELSKDGYYVNGEQIASAKDVGNITTPGNCQLYKANNYSTTSFLRVYSLKVYESDELIYDFVPAKRNDMGRTGLFDKVSGVFNVVSTETGFNLGNMYTLTINPTPSTATVTLTADGYTQTDNYIKVPKGTEVTYSVSASGYTTQTGTITLNDTQTINITLEASGDSGWGGSGGY